MQAIDPGYRYPRRRLSDIAADDSIPSGARPDHPIDQPSQWPLPLDPSSDYYIDHPIGTLPYDPYANNADAYSRTGGTYVEPLPPNPMMAGGDMLGGANLGGLGLGSGTPPARSRGYTGVWPGDVYREPQGGGFIPRNWGYGGGGVQWEGIVRPPIYDQMTNFLADSYVHGPTDLASQINYETGKYADQAFQKGMLDDLLGTIAGINAGGQGNRMQGFQDVKSGQYAALPGAGGGIGTGMNNVTAGAVPQSRINSAVNTARGVQTAVPPNRIPASTAGLQVPQAARDELTGRLNTSIGVQGNRNATMLGRTMGAENAKLGRQAALGASQQSLAHNDLLGRLDAMNTRNRLATTIPLNRMAGRMAGIG